jgi:hypothetical protein
MYAPHLEYGPPKLSGPGIASCVLAAISVGLAVIGTLVMVAARASSNGGQPTTGDWMLGFAMLGSVCGGGLLALVGVLLGIIGLSLPNRRKQVALIGLIANGGLMLTLVLIAMM